MTSPFVEFVENVPLAVPPSSKVTPESCQSMVEALAGIEENAAPTDMTVARNAARIILKSPIHKNSVWGSKSFCYVERHIA